jgi:zinc/manganese transport system substrate-binding protein
MNHRCLAILGAALLMLPGSKSAAQDKEAPREGSAKSVLNVVTTLPDYRVLAEAIGKEKITAKSLVGGDQDAHFIRPKPSFVTLVGNADVLISTGLDLELWLPTVIDKSNNTKIRSGEVGYVAAADGMSLLEVPENVSRAEGGVHIYGNPHVTCSPINMKVAARNVAAGLIKNDPANKDFYLKNLVELENEFDNRLFGEELVGILGGKMLCKLAEQDKLIPFLEKQKYKEKPLIDYLGGWLKQMLPLRGKSIVTYHKNWVYFLKLFGLTEVGTVEPKPGIPPSAKHVTELIETMKEQKIGIVLAANYFDRKKVEGVADKTGAQAVIVPLYVEGAEGVNDYFKLVDCWVEGLLAAAKEANLIQTGDDEPAGQQPEDQEDVKHEEK